MMLFDSIPKKYNSIDLVKFFMAIIVVAIHTQPLYYCNDEFVVGLYEEMKNTVVPFFFVASGFLMASKFFDDFSCEHNLKIVKNTLLHIIKLYVIWTVLYLPMTIYHLIQEGKPVLQQLLVFLRGLLFIGEQYNSWQLWYLLSTIYALIFIYFLMRHGVGRQGMIISGLVVYLVGIFISWFIKYEEALPNVLMLTQKILRVTLTSGRIFSGFFYIPVGIYLQKKKIPVKIAAPLFAFCFVLKIFVGTGPVNTLLNALAVIGFFEIILELKLKECGIYPLLRKMSTAIYFIHMYVWTAYYMLVYRTKTYGPDSFFVTVIISVMISFVYCKLKDRNRKKIVSD